MAKIFLDILACIILVSFHSASAIQLNLDDHASIHHAASTVAYGMMKYYHGNETGQTPGLLPEPYYWWEAGAMFGALIDYWRYTGDSTYNDVVSQAMLWQASANQDFMPPNQTKAEGNDDQAFWAITALMAAESGFPNPPPEDPQWLALAQAVFNLQAARWDHETCNGGLRWQIFPFNRGYHYKNSISQGGFFDLAVRLGAFTGNQTYYDWADKMYAWCESVGLISPTYQVFDGTDSLIKCSELNHDQWSYNTAIFLHGSAVMYNQTTGTTQETWRNRTAGFLQSSFAFFTSPSTSSSSQTPASPPASNTNKTIMYEAACERSATCNTDQRSFKAYLSRWLAATSQLAPFTAPSIFPLLRSSALAAAQSCSGGTDGVTCGQKWWVEGWDGNYGVGEQMSALEVIQSCLVEGSRAPLDGSDGGASQGNAGAGGGAGREGAEDVEEIGKRDREGAVALTVVLVLGTVAAAWWMAV